MYHMYMIDVSTMTEFEWDKGNLDKSYKKHGITPNVAEEIFLDENLVIQTDINHAQGEERYIAIGKTGESIILFVIFTVRVWKIRIISARRANKKERNVYEKTA